MFACFKTPAFIKTKSTDRGHPVYRNGRLQEMQVLSHRSTRTDKKITIVRYPPMRKRNLEIAIPLAPMSGNIPFAVWFVKEDELHGTLKVPL